MLRKLFFAAAFALLGLAATPSYAQQAIPIATCGTLSASLSVAIPHALYMDTSGNLCTSGSGGGGGGTSSTFGAAFPATGTAIGMSQGGNMVALNGLAGNLLVNCNVGCSGGSFNNNADNVATSATNGQAAAWGYLWDGTTWDRAPGNSTTGALVNVSNTNANGQATMANSSPVVIASNQSAVPTNPQAGTIGGCTPAKTLSAATTNSTSIKGSVGTLCKMITINTTATLYYLKMYNTAAAPTCNSDTVVATYPVPPSNGGVAVPLGPFGEAYTNGIGFCLTANLADNDNTAAATGVTISYSSK